MASVRRSLAIILPEPLGDPLNGPPDLTLWLHSLTESMLPGLLRQADPQHVIEYSLALITVLNEVSAGVYLLRVGAGLEECWLGPHSRANGWSAGSRHKIPNLIEMTSALDRPLHRSFPAPGFAHLTSPCSLTP